MFHSNINLSYQKKKALNFLFQFSIWKILALGHGHLNECCVPLLLHSLNYEPGKTALWNILERDFSSTHWKIRSSAGKFYFEKIKRKPNIFI